MKPNQTNEKQFDKNFVKETDKECSLVDVTYYGGNLPINITIAVKGKTYHLNAEIAHMEADK